MPRKSKRQVIEAARQAVQDVVEQAVKEEEAGEDRAPGSVVNGVKVPWTWKACEKVFGVVEFTPATSQPVTWNGLTKYFLADVPQLMPAIHRDIYLDAIRRSKRDVAKSMADRGITVDAGAGTL